MQQEAEGLLALAVHLMGEQLSAAEGERQRGRGSRGWSLGMLAFLIPCPFL